MTLFGFGKKSDGGSEDAAAEHHHVSLFRRSRSHSPKTTNPYAQMQPGYGVMQSSLDHPERPSHRANDAALESGAGDGYGAEKYGTGNGYASHGIKGASRYGPTGYGGFKREDSNETTTTNGNRQALFGDAESRLAQNPSLPEFNSHGSNTSTSNDQMVYGDRQLTAEEEEEEDIQATKQQIHFLKQSSVSSTRNALQFAAAAEQSGLATLDRLGAQGERLHNTQKNLDLAMNHNRLAGEKARELKTINSSMFAVHVGNPFVSEAKREAVDAEINERYRKGKDEREASRLVGQKRMGLDSNNLNENTKPRVPLSKSRIGERSKYIFEADSEDEELEDELDGNLDALGKAVGRLNRLARAAEEEVKSQQPTLDQIDITGKEVEEQIVVNRARLGRVY